MSWTTLQAVPEITDAPTAIATLIAYFVVVILIGGYFFRRARESVGDFWIADGKIPLSVQVFAYFAVATSAGTFFGIGGLTYQLGLGAGMLLLAATMVGLFFMMIFIASPLRRTGVYTLPDFLQVRYQSRYVRLVAAVIFAIISWAYIIPQLQAGGITVDFLLPWVGYEGGVLVSVVVFALYVSLGGMWAVTWTDFLQALIIIVLTLLPIPFVISDMGATGAISEAIAVNPGFGGSFMPELMAVGFSMALIFGIASLPNFGQRLLSSDSHRTARRSIMWTNLIYAIIFSLSAFILASAALAIEPNLAESDWFYYAVLSEYTGPLLQGFGAAALLAAVMSTTDALLIALSASVSHDIPNALEYKLSGRQETMFGIAVMWVGAFLAALIALDPPAIIALMVTLVIGISACGLFPTVVVGTWWKRGTKEGAIASMIVGTATYGILLLGGFMETPYVEVLVAAPLGLIVYVVVSLLTPRPSDAEMAAFRDMHEGIERR